MSINVIAVTPSETSADPKTAEREAQRAKLHAAIERGLEDARAGRSRPAEEVFDELKARYSGMLKQRSA